MTEKIRSLVFDVDGTLVNSNDAHAHAWVKAFADNGHTVAFETVRPLIGMGGDKVLPETIGVEKDSDEGKKISQRRKEVFLSEYLPHLQAFPQALDLLKYLHEHDFRLVTATSAEPDELSGLLRVLGPHAADLFYKETSSKDAPSSKPDPDIMEVALRRTGFSADQVLMVGDTGYDISAAAKVGIQTIAFRSGGWKDSDLKDALAIYDGPADLLAHFAESPLNRVAGR